MGLSYTQTSWCPTRSTCPVPPTGWGCCTSLCPVEFTEYSISALHGTGLEALRQAIFQALDVIRMYSKLPSAKDAGHGSAVHVAARGARCWNWPARCIKIISKSLKFARVWGKAVHDGTAMKGDYVLHDKDVVELHM